MDNEARIKQLAKTIAAASAELEALLSKEAAADEDSEFDHLDRDRRRRPEWQRRGRVFYAIDQAGGRVDMLTFIQILLQSGYKDMRGANGFFRGDPIPVLARDGDDVLLTRRGQHAARFYERYWLPQEGRDSGSIAPERP